MHSFRSKLKLLSMFLQEAVQYRSESFIWFLFDVIGPLVMILMWRSAYGPSDQFGGYTENQMMLYYVGMMSLRTLLNVHPEWEISQEIRTSEFSKHLLRPLGFNQYHLMGEAAWKLLRMIYLLPVVGIFLIWLGPVVLSAVGLTREMAIPFFGSLVLGYFLNYYIKVTLGLVAFWMTESVGVFNFFFLIQLLFEGTVIPLDLMPELVQRIGEFLPFRYFYFLSMSILQGKLDAPTAFQEIFTQFAWCIGAYLIMRIVFRMGVRNYSAVGG